MLPIADITPGWLWLLASARLLRRDLVPFRAPFGERLRALHGDRSRRPDWAQPPAWAWRPAWARVCVAVIAAASAGVVIGSFTGYLLLAHWHARRDWP
jgi:hypothetical protein